METILTIPTKFFVQDENEIIISEQKIKYVCKESKCGIHTTGWGVQMTVYDLTSRRLKCDTYAFFQPISVSANKLFYQHYKMLCGRLKIKALPFQP